MELDSTRSNLVDYFLVVEREKSGDCKIVFKYPSEDVYPFPDQIGMFTFPTDLTMDLNPEAVSTCFPLFHTFVLTGQQGNSLYGTSIAFQEQKRNGKESNHPLKSISFVSRWPFFSEYFAYLRELMILASQKLHFQQNTTALEKSLRNLVQEVPVPPRGGPRIQVSVNERPLTFFRPAVYDMPRYIDPIFFRYTIQLLDSDCLVNIFHYALLEKKILLFSKESILLTAVAETIRALLFPVEWHHIYIPFVPEQLDVENLIESPVPFIAGILESQVRRIRIPCSVIVINLDTSEILMANGTDVPVLPESSKVLLRNLRKYRTRADHDLPFQDLEMQRAELEQFHIHRTERDNNCENNQSAYDAALAASKPILQSFTNLLAIYLKDYEDFVYSKPAQDSPEEDVACFNSEQYTASKPTQARGFFRQFASTQGLIQFVRLHTESHSYDAEVELNVFYFEHLLRHGPTTTSTVPALTFGESAETFTAIAPEESSPLMLPDESRTEEFTFPALKVEDFGAPREIEPFPDINRCSQYRASIQNRLKSTRGQRKSTGFEWLSEFWNKTSRSRSESNGGDTLRLAAKFLSNARLHDKKESGRSAWYQRFKKRECEACEEQCQRIAALLDRHAIKKVVQVEQVGNLYVEVIHTFLACCHEEDAESLYFDFVRGELLIDRLNRKMQALLLSHLVRGLIFYRSNILRAITLFCREQPELCNSVVISPDNSHTKYAAQILSINTENVILRHHITFSHGSLGVVLASRYQSTGCVIRTFEAIQLDAFEDHVVGPGPAEKSGIIKAGDAIEYLNGKHVFEAAFDDIVQQIHQATRPLTIGFVRGYQHFDGLKPPSRLQRKASVVVERDIVDKYGILMKHGLRLSTIADCQVCSTRLTVAEIRRGWTGDSNDHETTCPRCLRKFVARLAIISYSNQKKQIDHFQYVSCAVLVKEVANITALETEPTTALSMESLRDEKPMIYWNLVAKFLSLDCSLDFLKLPSNNAQDQALIPVNNPHQSLKKQFHDELEQMLSLLQQAPSVPPELEQFFRQTTCILQQQSDEFRRLVQPTRPKI